MTHVLCSPASIARRQKALGLYGSGLTTKKMPNEVKRQLVLDQIADDPMSRQGPKLVRESIMRSTGVHLTR